MGKKQSYFRSEQMSKKPAPESKIPTTGINTNQKRKRTPEQDLDSGASLLKKNEFLMIIGAAFAITVLAFFFFFKNPSGDKQPDTQEALQSSGVTADLENRISSLEVSLAKQISSSDQKASQITSKAVGDLDDRVSRLETAVNLKLDTLIERMGKLEARLNRQKAAVRAVIEKKAAPVTRKTVSEPAAKAPEKVAVKIAKTKKTKTSKKNSQLHTVQKGETLYSISRKYNTSVGALRKLNNLTPEDKIYPGNHLLVR